MSTIHNPTNLKINTGTLLSQISLARTNDALTKSIRNISTGLRVESGRDDPVGFIAGSSMRTDLVSMKQAVSNSQRADKAISLIDSTLANVNSLLNDLRGIVTQAANTGVENTATIASLQLQADAIINVIDYYSTSTTFNGQKLLDGSLDFNLIGADTTDLQKVDIRQANFIGRTEKDIVAEIIAPPTRAELYYPLGGLANDTIFTIGGTNGYQIFNFDKTASLSDIANAVNLYSDATGVAAKVHAQGTTGSTSISSYGKNNDIILTASRTGKENGNFVVKYSAPKQGNESAFLNVAQGYGNDPTVIEVVLQTEKWSNAEYIFNKSGDSIADNEFKIVAKYAGAEFNNVNFEINNIFGNTNGAVPGIDVDLTQSPKVFRINISYNENNPNDPTNTTVQNLASWIADSPIANYFELQHTGQSDGSGVIIPDSKIETLKEGVNGGTITSTAEQIATLINTSPLLKNPDGSGRLSATIPSDALGIGTVSPFFDAAYYGSPQENNYLQFLAPENSPTIKFVSNPNELLSIDATSEPPVYSYAIAEIQGLDPDTSFTIKSRDSKLENNNVTIIMRDAVDESAIFDPEKNAVVISVDFTGRQNGTNPNGAFTMNDLVQMVENDALLGQRFTVIPQSGYDKSNPPKFTNEAYIGINAELGKTSGGLISAGTVVVHLETDANGIVKTTANDLVKFFNDPPTDDAKAVLDKLGISVSVISPGNTNETVSTTGNSEIGTGLLHATVEDKDNKNETANSEWNFGAIEFSRNLPDDVKASALLLARNGIDATFQVTARSADAKYDGTEIVVVSDGSGTNVSYDAQSKQITISIDPDDPPTSQKIVELINSTESVADHFVAAIPNSASVPPGSQPGSAPISVGDRGTLRAFYSDEVVTGSAGVSMLGSSDSEDMGLTFYSVEYGSAEFVEVVAGQGTNFPVRDKYGAIKEHVYGSDIVAFINNQATIGKGRIAMTSTSDLDMSIWFDGEVNEGEVIGFRVASGGVLIQLGPIATSSQQARISVPSIHSSQLGGVSGYLSDIKSNGIRDLITDVNAAFTIVDEVIVEISELRSRLGAFQKSRIEPNIDNISDSIEIETGAMSDIIDTDFAVESSELLRQQLLMQSNISVLQMSMQSRQMLLGLLTG